MTLVHEVVILQKSRRLPEKLRQQLRLKNIPPRTVFDVSGLEAQLLLARYPIVLLDCTDAGQKTVQTIQKIVDTPSVCDYPFIFITNQSGLFKESCERYLMCFELLDAPVDAETVLESLNRVIESYPTYLSKLQKFSPEVYASLKGNQYNKELITTTNLQSSKADISSKPATSPINDIFDDYHSLNLAAQSFGGSEYTSQIDEKLLVKHKVLPSDPKQQLLIQKVCKEFQTREKQHLYRTAFVSAKSTEAMQIPTKLKDKGVVASFLFASAFAGAKAHLLRSNYMQYTSNLMRQDIGTKIKLSSAELSEQGLSDISDILNRVAKLISQEDVSADTPIDFIAHNIMAADLMDRVCFHSGFWDPFAANKLLHAIKSGQLGEIAPRTLSCLTKFLAEAVAAKKPAFLIAPAARNISKTEADLGTELEENETAVELPQLEPGMQLSRPLMTIDGKELLSSDLKLDQDLIWRLWQLASVRPLITPRVFKDEKN
jgi:hypothetical protein